MSGSQGDAGFDNRHSEVLEDKRIKCHKDSDQTRPNFIVHKRVVPGAEPRHDIHPTVSMNVMNNTISQTGGRPLTTREKDPVSHPCPSLAR